jgi:hypothetical protein
MPTAAELRVRLMRAGGSRLLLRLVPAALAAGSEALLPLARAVACLASEGISLSQCSSMHSCR